MKITISVFVILLVSTALYFPVALANNVHLIGEWNDNVGTAWKQNIKIIKSGNKYFRISSFQDGSQGKSRLIELKHKPTELHRFKDIENAYGEIYVINSKGNLYLYDNEGFIRTAFKSGAKIIRNTNKFDEKESCYQLGVRYGRCASLSFEGLQCDPKDNIVKPKRCNEDSNFDLGIKVGVRQVLQK